MPEFAQKKSSRAKNLLIGAVALGIGIGIMTFAGSTGAKQENDDHALKNILPTVEITAARAVSDHYVISAPGRLTPRQRVTIVGEISGKVAYVNPKFTMGGRFEAGEVLFKINQADYQAERVRAEAGLMSGMAQLKKAKSDHTRRVSLANKGTVSEAAREAAIAAVAAAEAGVKQAEAGLTRAEENVKRTEVRAPFPALVLSENTALGSYVSPGQKLGEIMDTRLGELVVGLSPQETAEVARVLHKNKGALKVTARPNNGSVGSEVIRGTIDKLSPAIDGSSRSALVVATFPNAFSAEKSGKIFSNDFMTLEIKIKPSETLWEIPVGVLRKDQFIWTISPDHLLVKNPVTLVHSAGNTILVSAESDLSDAKIMASFLSEEEEGMKISIAQKTSLSPKLKK